MMVKCKTTLFDVRALFVNDDIKYASSTELLDNSKKGKFSDDFLVKFLLTKNWFFCRNWPHDYQSMFSWSNDQFPTIDNQWPPWLHRSYQRGSPSRSTCQNQRSREKYPQVISTTRPARRGKAVNIFTTNTRTKNAFSENINRLCTTTFFFFSQHHCWQSTYRMNAANSKRPPLNKPCYRQVSSLSVTIGWSTVTYKPTCHVHIWNSNSEKILFVNRKFFEFRNSESYRILSKCTIKKSFGIFVLFETCSRIFAWRDRQQTEHEHVITTWSYTQIPGG